MKRLAGWQIRRVRYHLEMNQEEFADFVGVSPITVSRWENDKVIPSYLAQYAIQDLAARRGVTIPTNRSLRRPRPFRRLDRE